MSATHSVEQHLHVGPDAYDAMIRRFVPHYEEMIDTGVAWLASLAPKAPRVLDLGGGTGALTQAVARGLPAARVTLLDIDAAMLEQAQSRLRSEMAQGRATLQRGSFFDPLPACDAIVASLSLHHVRELDRKTQLYTAIHAALPPGGVFLSLDAVVSAEPRLAELTYQRWARAMPGFDEAEARAHIASWAVEDRYYSVHEELTALAAAGFAAPECFWRRGSVAVFGGVK